MKVGDRGPGPGVMATRGTWSRYATREGFVVSVNRQRWTRRLLRQGRRHVRTPVPHRSSSRCLVLWADELVVLSVNGTVLGFVAVLLAAAVIIGVTAEVFSEVTADRIRRRQDASNLRCKRELKRHS